jgi:hypothetical protein
MPSFDALSFEQLFGGKYGEAAGYSPMPCPAGECPNPDLEDKPLYHFDYFDNVPPQPSELWSAPSAAL